MCVSAEQGPRAMTAGTKGNRRTGIVEHYWVSRRDWCSVTDGSVLHHTVEPGTLYHHGAWRHVRGTTLTSSMSMFDFPFSSAEKNIWS